MKAYLSGAMEFANDEGTGWRSDITEWLDVQLNHSVYNPVLESQSLVEKYNAKNYRKWKIPQPKKYANFIRHCVNQDIASVRNKVDYIICLWDKNVLKGAGTHAEVTLGYECQKQVYLINKLPEAELSGWIMACSSKIFSDFEQLKNYLLQQYLRDSI
jgi:hypothetical protein